MREITIDELNELASDAKEDIWTAAENLGREPKIYLHWTAGHYEQVFDDYHICIEGDGTMCLMADLDETLNHTWRRNTGSIGIALCCCVGATTDDLGNEPPTNEQIEAMAKAVAAIADGLDIPIDIEHVMTHGEAADSEDGDESCYGADDCYGPLNGCERWDLQFLGTDESPEYTTDYDDPATGGNVLRGKAAWYMNEWEKEGRC